MGQFKTTLTIRQMANVILKNKPPVIGFKLSEAEVIRLYHELQVHQIELELINEELLDQNKEKEKRAGELVIANTLVSFQRDRLEEIASLVPGLVYQYRLRPDGSSCFPYSSEAIRSIYRVTPEEVLEDATNVFAKLHPDDLDRVLASIQKSAKDLTPWLQEYRVKFEDGTMRTLLGHSLPRLEEDGSVLWHGFVTDITERKKIEEELQQTNTRLALATVAGGIGIWDYDMVNNRLFWDDQMFALFGLKRNDSHPVHEDWHASVHPDDIERCDKEIKLVIASKKAFNSEFRVVWPDGSIHSINATGIVICDESGKVLNLIGTNEDFTSRLKSENEIKFQNSELLRLNAEKDKFFSIIAHDLRGPLGGFMGLTEMMADESIEFTEAEKKKMTLDLSRSARNTFNLLENLLEWSQMNRGLTKFNPQTLDLITMVTKCSNIVAESARKKMIELIVAIPDRPEVFADENMILTVMRNLLSNAIKFTPHGGRVTISAKPAGNRMMVISVKDTGIGMSNEMKNNLFLIDAKIKRPGTDGEPSNGLGLLLCKEFVGKQGGKIGVESEQFKGTVFSFTIPSVGPGGNKIAGLKFTDKPAGEISNLKILIAEDDEISAKLIHAIVKGFSREVFQAKTGKHAVEICRNNAEIDLVLMDIGMPVMDGFEATRQIRQFNQEVVIIAQTTFALNADLEKSFEAGCNDNITKPFGKEALVELIKKHIKG